MYVSGQMGRPQLGRRIFRFHASRMHGYHAPILKRWGLFFCHKSPKRHLRRIVSLWLIRSEQLDDLRNIANDSWIPRRPQRTYFDIELFTGIAHNARDDLVFQLHANPSQAFIAVVVGDFLWLVAGDETEATNAANGNISALRHVSVP
ncbi:MAG: hypothetical protein HC888_00325 [Candidatus Competibacteraceae bacterium]|nr:hypothetical protein [Candidatus Competibacteraceae bacterium]